MKTLATGLEWVGLAQTDARKFMRTRDRELLAEARQRLHKHAPPKTPADHKPMAIKLFFWWLLHKITGGS